VARKVKRFLGEGMSMEQVSERMDVSVKDLEWLLKGGGRMSLIELPTSRLGWNQGDD